MNTPTQSANIAPGPLWALMSPFGRIGREPYWLCFALVLVIAMIVFGIPFRIWVNTLTDLQATENLTIETLALADFMEAYPIVPIMFLAMNWIYLVLVIKRLQDFGLSGFFALLIFVPVLSVLMVIMVGFVPSQMQPNKNGPMPNSYWRKS